MKSFFFKDGGPIVAVQVDNETSDWKYLLALRSLALDVGIDPTFYTKTGWPDPNPGFPQDYPMLQFKGGYPDQFWNNKMQPTPSSGSYQFAPSNQVQSAFPLLDVEIGGGMATAYNHRVRMYSEDMPSLHTVLLANGVNCLGYYMYHGGTNPHSLKNHSDCPESTLQESSFQPAGAQNPMTQSRTIFAPLARAREHTIIKCVDCIYSCSILAVHMLLMPRIGVQATRHCDGVYDPRTVQDFCL